MGGAKLSTKITIIREKCDPLLAKDKTLPCTAYLVEYVNEGVVEFDIVLAQKQVDIFDHYWDQYKENFKTFSQAAGTVSPRLWEDPQKPKPKK